MESIQIGLWLLRYQDMIKRLIPCLRDNFPYPSFYISGGMTVCRFREGVWMNSQKTLRVVEAILLQGSERSLIIGERTFCMRTLLSMAYLYISNLVKSYYMAESLTFQSLSFLRSQKSCFPRTFYILYALVAIIRGWMRFGA